LRKAYADLIFQAGSQPSGLAAAVSSDCLNPFNDLKGLAFLPKNSGNNSEITSADQRGNSTIIE